jgi:hypothetical protein
MRRQDSQIREAAAESEHSAPIVPRPYDSRELDRLPGPTEQDRPYRAWWVIVE